MPTTSQDAVFYSACEYASMGWRVIPIRAGEKRPLPTEWQKVASRDEDQITKWWARWPDAGVGVKLGPDSGIIDVECDDDEAEQTLLALFEGEFPVTPTFMASRGKHRLFRYRDDLPEKEKNGFKIGKIEFRTGGGGKGAQSVFPPSVHPSGAVYTWLVPPDDCPPAELSERVVMRIWNALGGDTASFFGPVDKRVGRPAGRKREHWEALSEGVSEGSRNEAAASWIGRVLGDMNDAFDAAACERCWVGVRAWNTQNNPPLPEMELAKTFDSILRRHRARITDVATGEAYKVDAAFVAAKTVEGTPKGADAPPPAAAAPSSPPPPRLVIVDSRPREFLLYHPYWFAKTENGHIVLSSKEMMSAGAIMAAALEQADTWVPEKFKGEWPTLARRLVDTAEHLEAPLETRRDVMILQLLYLAIRDAKPLREDAKGPPKNGFPWIDEDGNYLFSFDPIWQTMHRSEDKVMRKELAQALSKAGAVEVVVGTKHSRKRVRKLTPDQFLDLSHQVS